MPFVILDTFGQPNRDLKALRLCCKQFVERGAPYLYKLVLVFITIESFAKLKKIASHPEYRQMVKEVRVYPRQFRKETRFGDLEAFRDHLKHPGDELSDYYDLSDREDLEYGHVEELPETRIRSGYAHYARLSKVQQLLLPRVQGLLVDAFGKFQSLQTVVAGRFAPLALLERGQRPRLPSSLRDFYLKTLLVHGDTHAGPCYQWEIADEAITLIRAVASGAPRIERLQLSHDGNWASLDLSSCCLSSADLEFLPSLFAKLKTLNFPVTGWHRTPWGGHDRSATTKVWAKLLNSCHNMENLVLSVGFDYYLGHGFLCWPKIFSSDTHLPKLSTLKLWHIPFSQAQLLAMVERHACTLKKLDLDGVLLSAGSWRGTLIEIRREGLEVSVSCLQIWKAKKKPSMWFTKNDEVNQHKLLDGFLHQEQLWPAGLPSGLSDDAQDFR